METRFHSEQPSASDVLPKQTGSRIVSSFQDKVAVLTIPDARKGEHSVRAIDAFVNGLHLELAGFIRTSPKKTGRSPYDPRELLKLYVYGYFNKIRSSRKLMTESTRNIELFCEKSCPQNKGRYPQGKGPNVPVGAPLRDSKVVSWGTWQYICLIILDIYLIHRFTAVSIEMLCSVKGGLAVLKHQHIVHGKRHAGFCYLHDIVGRQYNMHIQ